MLASMVHRFPDRWREYMRYILYAYNTSFHETIRNTPFFLMYGRDPSKDIVNLNAVEIDSEEVSSRIRLLREAWHDIAHKISMAHDRAKIAFDRKSQGQKIKIGSMVFVRIMKKPTGTPRKLAPHYVGPYRVRHRSHDTLFVTPVQAPNRAWKRIHVNLVKPCVGTFAMSMSPDELELPFAEPNLTVGLEEEDEDDSDD